MLSVNLISTYFVRTKNVKKKNAFIVEWAVSVFDHLLRMNLFATFGWLKMLLGRNDESH